MNVRESVFTSDCPVVGIVWSSLAIPAYVEQLAGPTLLKKLRPDEDKR